MKNLSVSSPKVLYSRCKSCARVDLDGKKKQCDYCGKEMQVVSAPLKEKIETETEEDSEKS